MTRTTTAAAQPDASIGFLIGDASDAHSNAQTPLNIGRRALAAGVAIELLVAAVAIAGASYVGRRPDAFFEEGSFITIFSSLQIIALAGMCALLYQIRSEQSASPIGPHLMWAIGACGLALLVLDEAFGLHEMFDLKIHALAGLEQTPWTDRIDDLIVLCYGLAAGGLALAFRRELLKLLRLRSLFIISLALFLAMVAVDLLSNSYSSNHREILEQRAELQMLAACANAFEDTIKLSCEASIFAGLLAAAHLFKRNAVE